MTPMKVVMKMYDEIGNNVFCGALDFLKSRQEALDVVTEVFIDFRDNYIDNDVDKTEMKQYIFEAAKNAIMKRLLNKAKTYERKAS